MATAPPSNQEPSPQCTAPKPGMGPAREGRLFVSSPKFPFPLGGGRGRLWHVACVFPFNNSSLSFNSPVFKLQIRTLFSDAHPPKIERAICLSKRWDVRAPRPTKSDPAHIFVETLSWAGLVSVSRYPSGHDGQFLLCRATLVLDSVEIQGS